MDKRTGTLHIDSDNWIIEIFSQPVKSGGRLTGSTLCIRILGTGLGLRTLSATWTACGRSTAASPAGAGGGAESSSAACRGETEIFSEEYLKYFQEAS